MSEDEAEIVRAAERLGVELPNGRRSGDHINLAILERLDAIDKRLAAHQAREEQLYGSFVLMGCGAVLSVAPMIAHSVSQALTLVSGQNVTITFSPGRATSEILETIGGAMMLAGAISTISPRLFAAFVGRVIVRMGSGGGK